MKTQLSSLELHYIVKELQALVDAKIDQIYQPEKKEIILQFHVPKLGKKMLKIMVPNYFFLTSVKEFTERPPGFCMLLRKYLSNARLRGIKQLESERIVEIVFETKEAKYSLIIELFSKGNIIFCKEDYTIINPLENQSWKDREVKKSVKYKYPQKDYNLFNIKQNDLKELIAKSTRESIVKTLAVDLGLGGVYSEELLLLAKIDKTKPKLDDNEIGLLYEILQNLIDKKISPAIITKDNVIIDITPFDLKYYKDYNKKPAKTYNEALDELSAVKLDEATIRYNKKLEKLKLIILDQETTIKRLETSQAENFRNGELIYEKYQLVNEILTEINKARKKFSWQEIKDKVKGHKIVKEINEKEGKVVVEV